MLLCWKLAKLYTSIFLWKKRKEIYNQFKKLLNVSSRSKSFDLRITRINLMNNIISIFIYNMENLISLVYKNKSLMSETSWVRYGFDLVASEWVKIRCGFGQVNKLRFNFAKSNHTRYMISHTILKSLGWTTSKCSLLIN